MINRFFLWGLRAAVAVGLMGGIVLLSRWPVGTAPQEGQVRLAWRMVGEKATSCRPYTEDERRNIPQHMQGQGKCEQSILPYRLQFWLDGRLLLDEVVHPGGIRSDRPLYVQEDFRASAGPHQIRLHFRPAPAGDTASDSVSQAVEEAPAYSLDSALHFKAGRIVLIDLDERRGHFVVVEG